jgi:hypothetical protein
MLALDRAGDARAAVWHYAVQRPAARRAADVALAPLQAPQGAGGGRGGAAVPTGQPGIVEYRLTEAGEDLRPVVMALGIWGQRWVEKSLSLKNLDPSLLMWDMRRCLDPTPLPKRRCTINFLYPDVQSGKRSWWLVIEETGKVDLCLTNPGFDIDLYVKSALRSMTAIWMGFTTVAREVDAGHVELIGDASVARSMQQWLGLSVFAKEKSRVAA